MPCFVVDASNHQRGLDVASLPALGIAAAIFKATEGVTFRDASFAGFAEQARRVRLPHAAYHYLHQRTRATEQARATADVVPADVPVWIDVEAGATLDKAGAYGAALRSLGLRVAGIYHHSRPAPGWGGWWRAAYLGDPTGPPAATYARQGGDTGSGWRTSSGSPDLWQYCQHGRIPGYPGDVDLSAYRGTLAQLLGRGWFWTPDAVRPSTGGSMDLYRDSDGHIWDVGQLGRRYITHPDVVAAYTAGGGQVADISAAALATIPRLPDDGLPAWVVSTLPPQVAMVDVVDEAVLAEEIVRRLPAGHGLSPAAVADEVAIRLSR